METLPPEMIQEISRYLTPTDLAHCSGASRKWRGIFDQDWLWKFHCDSTLEEGLRTTTSVVEPVFVNPEDENSTLPTISKWRLAFMRENHLRGNWKRKVFRSHSLASENNDSISSYRAFLQDNYLVNCWLSWYDQCIQIWNVGVVPATLVVESKSSFDSRRERFIECVLVASDTLLFLYHNCIQVYLVDITNKCIELKHEIPLEEPGINFGFNYDFIKKEQISADGSVILGVTAGTSTLTIFDLGSGKKITTEPCPVMQKKGNAKICKLITSETCDDVLVWIRERDTFHYYIYSFQQQLFLPGPIASTKLPCGALIAINKHYVVFSGRLKMTILDYHTSEVVFEDKDQVNYIHPQAYKDCFVFVSFHNRRHYLKMFSLTDKCVTTVWEYDFDVVGVPYNHRLRVINDRYVVLIGTVTRDWGCSESLVYKFVFEPSGQSLKRVDYSLGPNEVINTACTRGFDTLDSTELIYYF